MEQFRLGCVEAWSPDALIQSGEDVAVMGRAIGVWWLNACRIVYVVDESGPIRKFGFAYGILPGHVENGEERFLIEWDRGEKSVWCDILAFSRPNHFLIRLGYLVVRRLQKRLGRDSRRRCSGLSATNSFLIRDLPDDPARISSGEYAVRDAPCDYASGSDDGLRADLHSGADDRTTADPYIRPDLNGLGEFCFRRISAFIG